MPVVSNNWELWQNYSSCKHVQCGSLLKLVVYVPLTFKNKAGRLYSFFYWDFGKKILWRHWDWNLGFPLLLQGYRISLSPSRESVFWQSLAGHQNHFCSLRTFRSTGAFAQLLVSQSWADRTTIQRHSSVMGRGKLGILLFTLYFSLINALDHSANAGKSVVLHLNEGPH